MKYTKEQSDEMSGCYNLGSGMSVKELAEKFQVPERSIIAKLSSLGVYVKKSYLTKNGTVPIKKMEYIDRLASLLDADVDTLESLEKVNKSVLALIERKLLNIADLMGDESDPKLQ